MRRVIYRELAETLRRDIESGVHGPGGLLPSEASLGADFGVSRVTVPAFVAGTFIGLIPGTLPMALWGDDAARGFADSPLVGFGVLVAVGLVGYGLYRLRQRALLSRS